MDYCELVRKISVDPSVKMSVHLGHEITVRELLEIRKHIAGCEYCLDLSDKINQEDPKSKEFYKGELN